MDSLYESERHQPLTHAVWEETAARAGITAIADEATRTREQLGYWPVHALDEDLREPDQRMHSLYLGDAGVLWALHYLSSVGAIAEDKRWQAQLNGVHAAYLQKPDTGSVVPSWFLGEVGILLAANAEPERVYRLITENIHNPALEALWGAPGTMLGALFMFERTGESRWRDLYLQNADFLWQTLQHDAEFGCSLWTQELYGHRIKLIGAGHGFAGNAYALLRGQSVLTPDQRQQLYQRIAQTLTATAQGREGLANWPQSMGTPRPGRSNWLLQWCHGAPGMITALADFPPGIDPGVDQLLLEGGELVWQAGPLHKGAGLCHGTAGNGYAFLKLYHRSGDSRWLERARAFAMHALMQCSQARQEYGRGRYTLWTGDLGLAVYLWHCIGGKDSLPGLDIV